MLRSLICLPLLFLFALAPLDVSDTDALLEKVDDRVTVEGMVEHAAWSRSGKVMNIRFKDVGEKGFMAALFERQREKFDEAFDGDVAKAIAGRRVRITGKLVLYGGHIEELKGRPEIILRDPDQLEIVKPDSPTSRPADDEEEPDAPSTQPSETEGTKKGLKLNNESDQ
ncbi:MAG: hypothetical protein AAGD32_01220 [Planctomycetota bacterium]